MTPVRIVAVIHCGKTGAMISLASSGTRLLPDVPARDDSKHVYRGL